MEAIHDKTKSVIAFTSNSYDQCAIHNNMLKGGLSNSKARGVMLVSCGDCGEVEPLMVPKCITPLPLMGWQQRW